MPDGDAVAPPELAGDAPVANIFEPVGAGGALIIGDHFDKAVEDDFLRRLGERLHFHEPLRGEARFDNGFAAVAGADGVRVLGDAVDEAELFEVSDNASAGDEAFEAGIFSGGFAHVGVVSHHVNFGEIVALADFEVVGIVRGRDFDYAGAEFAVDVGVRNDGNFAVHQRQHYFFADEVFVAVVVGMDG